ncbi:glucosamine-6-phosphate deaminase [Intrasporangium oryzae NRRL B-24470]|uniref:Glucosamine-6-phosphate deaminase n=1 Tax=Intrasporangium oryzae NRRL B-24470 TaxID=1386089 RepID=W9GDX7_9MICO|nr:glucosamine-6-phosphate deaminase [Intrasporangium oryzae]EWT02054.1 glucosamine-6-phosphate deaminase [Intrasporangium oryzae NRRL B-24470]
MEVFVTAGPEEAARRAARVVIEAVAESVAAGRAPVVGLATGSSPLGLYKELALAVDRGQVDFSEAYGFALDEYVGLPAGHPESYREVLVAEVCRRVGLAPERLHVPDGSGRNESELAAGAARYEELIRGVGGIDVQILGIGRNGHIGFNEPGSSLTSRTRVKRLSSRTRADNARFFESLDDVPTHCVTQGLGTVLEARRLLLVATGASKAPAVAAAVEGPLTASCPGSVLQFHADALVVVDEAAAAGLRNREYYDESAAGL